MDKMKSRKEYVSAWEEEVKQFDKLLWNLPECLAGELEKNQDRFRVLILAAADARDEKIAQMEKKYNLGRVR